MSSSVVLVFDVMGTLFPLTPLGEELNRLIKEKIQSHHRYSSFNETQQQSIIMSIASGVILSKLLYAETLRDSIALSYTNQYTPFGSLLKLTVKRMIRRAMFESMGENVDVSKEEIERVLSLLSHLPIRMEAKTAIHSLASHATLIALTNGSKSTTSQLFENAGILSLFNTILSVDEVECSKPDIRVYQLLHSKGKIKNNDRVYFISQHSWDLHGVINYNRTTLDAANQILLVHISQEEKDYLNINEKDRPDVNGENWNEIAEKILAKITQSQ